MWKKLRALIAGMRLGRENHPLLCLVGVQRGESNARLFDTVRYTRLSKVWHVRKSRYSLPECVQSGAEYFFPVLLHRLKLMLSGLSWTPPGRKDESDTDPVPGTSEYESLYSLAPE